MSEPFTDVSFPDEHPAARVADHEVLMSFTNDSDALLFRDWWEKWGQHLFGEYAKAPKPVARRPGIPSRQEIYQMAKKRSEELQTRWYDDE